jgi:hypothetical protein
VGRFNAANLPLIRTVLEVHLRLLSVAGTAKPTTKAKPLLLFVLRDCDGETPVERLQVPKNKNSSFRPHTLTLVGQGLILFVLRDCHGVCLVPLTPLRACSTASYCPCLYPFEGVFYCLFKGVCLLGP